MRDKINSTNLKISDMQFADINDAETIKNDFIKISEKDPRYFEYSNGASFIPLGLNLCFPRFAKNKNEVFLYYEKYISIISKFGGNFVRIWLGSPFFELEKNIEGCFEQEQLENIKKVIKIAKRHNVRIKFTLEHFRTISPRDEVEMFPGAACFCKSVYHRDNGGSLNDKNEFLNTEKGFKIFLNKLDFLALNFSKEDTIMAWELWNEVNCTGDMELWSKWTEKMLPELKKRFPKHMTLQSIGSFDDYPQCKMYEWLGNLKDCSYFQVHRYLDPGAKFRVCTGSVDVLCADAIETLNKINNHKPLILAEAGAVEANHSAPSHLYDIDKDGMILHDVLFAPFFAGAAGPGQCWHWEFYIIKNNLWWHFERFSKAIEGIDPCIENFRALKKEDKQLRYYCLDGKKHLLIFVRDKEDNWQNSLEHRIPTKIMKGLKLELKKLSPAAFSSAEFYAPWSDERNITDLVNENVNLPDFKRSLVVKLKKDNQ